MTTPNHTITVPERYAAHIPDHALDFYEDEDQTPTIRLVRGVVKVSDPDHPDSLDLTTYFYRGRSIWQNDNIPKGYGGRWKVCASNGSVLTYADSGPVTPGFAFDGDSLDDCKRHVDNENAAAQRRAATVRRTEHRT